MTNKRLFNFGIAWIGAFALILALMFLIHVPGVNSQGLGNSEQGANEGGVYPLFVGVADTAIPTYLIDPTTNLSNTAFVGTEVWSAAYDNVNDRILFTSGTTLHEWPIGGTVNTLGTITNGAGGNLSVVGLAFYNGTLYGYTASQTEGIYSIDPSTLIGTLHIATVAADTDCGGLAADPADGTFYCTSDDTTGPGGAGLYIVNGDGSLTFVTAYPAGETDVDGLTVGTDGNAYLVTDDDTPQEIYVYDLAGGTYLPSLVSPWPTGDQLFSAGAWIAAPPGPNPAISLNKTVGTDPNTCAANTSITVSPGTDVTYCYEVSNTGNVDLTVNDLVDSELGTILSGFPYSLSVGANVFVTATANIVTDTTNIATWTACNIDGPPNLTCADGAAFDVVSDTASADVIVLGAPDIEVDPASLNETLATNMMSTQVVTISNIGVSDLNWTIDEEAAQPLPEYVAGLYAPSAGAAPVDGVGVTTSGEGTSNILLGSMVRAWNSQNGPYFTIFDLDTPATLPNIAAFPGTGAFIGAGEFVNGLSYMVDGSNNVFEVDDAGTIQNQYTATAPPNGESYSGMALDPTDGMVYASSTSVASSSICVFNVTTGVATSCDPISGSPGHIALAIDGAGNAFGYDIVNDTFMQIDPNTGATSNVVALPFDANFGQGMGYDPATGLLYMLAFNNGAFQAELWTVNTSNPAAPVFSFIGVLGSSVPGGLNQLAWGGTDIGPGGCNPNDIPWLSVNPTNGTTAPSGDSPVDVTFDSTGMSPGTYTGDLCIGSNDPVDPVVRVPVTLDVAASAPSIVLTKTVGTDNSTCATTSVLAVGQPSTEVYYCYTIQNTGDVTFNTHDLFDDKLGQLLTGFPQVVTPGQTYSYYPVTATITNSVTNVATWTAYVDSATFATATATATVTEQPTAVSLDSFNGGSPIALPAMIGLLALLAFGALLLIRRFQADPRS